VAVVVHFDAERGADFSGPLDQSFSAMPLRVYAQGRGRRDLTARTSTASGESCGPVTMLNIRACRSRSRRRPHAGANMISVRAVRRLPKPWLAASRWPP